MRILGPKDEKNGSEGPRATNFLCTQFHITLFEPHFRSHAIYSLIVPTVNTFRNRNCHRRWIFLHKLSSDHEILSAEQQFSKISRWKFEFSLKLSAIIIFLSQAACGAFIVILKLSSNFFVWFFFNINSWKVTFVNFLKASQCDPKFSQCQVIGFQQIPNSN